jgi:hypothetical protein
MESFFSSLKTSAPRAKLVAKADLFDDIERLLQCDPTAFDDRISRRCCVRAIAGLAD